MNLTEPQAGSDVGALRTRAERAGDGTYRITGSKIFITYGEHDLTDNIIHLVLARLPDAPPGTRGISLFLVPKFFVNDDGIARRPQRRALPLGIEHKLGIHASPTCTMVYGDKGGATGWLVGEENRGLACMFTMMNNARLAVGLQGVAIAERATQQALAYAHERRQGRAVAATAWPDHQPPRRAAHAADDAGADPARRASLCYQTADAIDRAHRVPAMTPRARRRMTRASLLTPVAKAFSTDIGIEVASLGVQVHGGMGFIEETGAAQHYRDARIAAIYEGTNGIQAIDLVTRKLPLRGGDDGARLSRRIARDRRGREGDQRSGVRRDRRAAGGCGRQPRARDDVAPGRARRQRRTRALPARRPICGCSRTPPAAARSPTRRWRRSASTAAPATRTAGRVALARFFAENIAVDAPALERTVTEGGEAISAAALADAG